MRIDTLGEAVTYCTAPDLPAHAGPGDSQGPGSCSYSYSYSGDEDDAPVEELAERVAIDDEVGGADPISEAAAASWRDALGTLAAFLEVWLRVRVVGAV